MFLFCKFILQSHLDKSYENNFTDKNSDSYDENPINLTEEGTEKNRLKDVKNESTKYNYKKEKADQTVTANKQSSGSPLLNNLNRFSDVHNKKYEAKLSAFNPSINEEFGSLNLETESKTKKPSASLSKNAVPSQNCLQFLLKCNLKFMIKECKCLKTSIGQSNLESQPRSIFEVIDESIDDIETSCSEISRIISLCDLIKKLTDDHTTVLMTCLSDIKNEVGIIRSSTNNFSDSFLGLINAISGLEAAIRDLFVTAFSEENLKELDQYLLNNE